MTAGRLLALALTLALASACSSTASQHGHGRPRDTDESSVHGAVDDWILALNAMLAGDPLPFAGVYSHADDVWYMGAENTYRVGWGDTWDDWQDQAARSHGGHVEARDVHVVVGDGMATATHMTVGWVYVAGQRRETAVRESSVFRKEDGRWLMIGHHCDALPAWEIVVDG